MSRMPKSQILVWLSAVAAGAALVFGLPADLATLSNQFFDHTPQSKQLRIKATECRDAAFRYLNGDGVEKATGQFHCAADNFKRAIAEGDGLSKVFLARLYSDAEAQHFLGKHSQQDYLIKAGHLWCEAKAQGVPIAQGDPPFETDILC